VVEKRTIEEIAAICEHELTIGSVYVEGNSDANLIKWFLSRKGKRDLSVYPIDSVNIPNEIISSYSLSLGSRKNQLIALSYELDKIVKDKEARGLCIVDLDFDEYLSVKHRNSFLGYTDYISLEIYLFTEKPMGKFLEVVLLGYPIPIKKLITQMIDILQKLFKIRLAN